MKSGAVSLCARVAGPSVVFASMLCACASPGNVGAPGAGVVGQPLDGMATFTYTGAKQSFKVPAGVTRITIVASGANGASGYGFRYSKYTAPGGPGGRVKATIAVTPGERLAIFVGGSGGDGGFNGGGESSQAYGGIGGGASDVRQRGDGMADRVVVAGGGGGGGSAGSCISTSCGYSEGGPAAAAAVTRVNRAAPARAILRRAADGGYPERGRNGRHRRCLGRPL